MGLIRRSPGGCAIWIPGAVAASLGLDLAADAIRDPSDGSATLLRDESGAGELMHELAELPYGIAHIGSKATGEDWARAVIEARVEGKARLDQMTGPGADEKLVRRFLDEPVAHFVFQPIVSLADGTPHAFEILARPRGISIADLVAAAARSGRGIDVDFALLDAALRRIGAMDEPIHVHVNVLPSTLLHARFTVAEFAARCRAAGAEPHRITVECTEHQVVHDLDLLAERVADLRLAGFGVGVDDAGAGHASFGLIARVRPTTIKIDRGIVSGCHQDSARQGLVQAFVMFARRIGASLVAEGVETNEDLDELSGLGVDLIQGYLLGRPVPEPEMDQAGRDAVARVRRGAAGPMAAGSEPVGPIRNSSPIVGEPSILPTVASIAAPAPVVSPNITGLEARQLFLDDPAVTTLAFTDPLGRPTAAITRDRLLGSFSGQYGYALFAHRPAMELAELSPATVRSDESIVNVAVSTTARTYASLYDDLLVVDAAGALVGLVRFRDLLRALANADLEEARDTNPLTGLPGNRRIEQVLAVLLGQDKPVAVSYVDLNHFKRFNDLAGFIAGDRVICSLGRALVDVAGRRGARFVGHIGGDDFIVVWADARDAQVGALEFYRGVSGAIGALDGLPEGVQVPGVTVATILLAAGQIRDVSTLAKRLATLKNLAKERDGNIHAIATLANLTTPRWNILQREESMTTYVASLPVRQGSLLA